MTRYIVLEKKDILNLILGKKVVVEYNKNLSYHDESIKVKTVLVKESVYKKEIK